MSPRNETGAASVDWREMIAVEASCCCCAIESALRHASSTLSSVEVAIFVLNSGRDRSRVTGSYHTRILAGHFKYCTVGDGNGRSKVLEYSRSIKRRVRDH